MKKIFCGREFKPETKDIDTSELEQAIKQKLTPIQIELDEKINKLLYECEKEHNTVIIVHFQDRKVHTIFSVDIDNFKI